MFLGNGRMLPFNQCVYDLCIADKECGAGRLCMCSGGDQGRNACLPANCHDDADCPASKCQISPAGVGDMFTYGAPNHYCKTADDTCTPEKGCKEGEGCGYDTKRSRFVCMATHYPPPG